MKKSRPGYMPPIPTRSGLASECSCLSILDQAFSPAYPALVAEIRSDEYYVNMMIAWYFATALAKQYEAVLPYLQQHRLARWTHNKAIQKAIESDRITAEQKLYLRTLKQK